MNIIDIIIKKKNKEILTEDEIKYVVDNYVNGVIADYQMSALLMAITLNGMNDDEVYYLTKAMIESGDIIDLSEINGITVDKHSTGGVGDKTTIALAPILACLGFKVAKMSGRGLGHTGGTIDKLESIKGYNVNLSEEEFIEQVNKIGVSVISQTAEVAIADKKIYALRDVTGLAESIPLIASSIMSKKIASSASIIVIDVKVGNGALMKNKEDATTLANTMIKLGKRFNRDVVCVLTNMEEPLGYAIGNNLEVIEAIEALKGNMQEDVKQVVLELGAYILKLAGKGDNIQENKEKMLDVIKNGKAYEKFVELVEKQGGDVTYIKDTSKFEKAKYVFEVRSKKNGIVKELNAENIGKVACFLGAGRTKKDDKIDMSAGIVLNKKIHDFIEEDDCLCEVHCNNEKKGKEAVKLLEEIFKIG